MTTPKLILASASPRRRELLAQIGIPCRVLPVDLDESPLPGEVAEVYVRRLALDKARAALMLLGHPGGALVLGADTAVVVDGEVLGKPRDAEDAATMLGRLSGRWHRVLSGVALLGPDGAELSAVSESRVLMRPIGQIEAAAYWATGEPADKAGGYAIQGRAAVFVEALEGSFSGVMGLPLYETAALLAAAGLAPIPTNRDKETTE